MIVFMFEVGFVFFGLSMVMVSDLLNDCFLVCWDMEGGNM